MSSQYRAVITVLISNPSNASNSILMITYWKSHRFAVSRKSNGFLEERKEHTKTHFTYLWFCLNDGPELQIKELNQPYNERKDVFFSLLLVWTRFVCLLFYFSAKVNRRAHNTRLNTFSLIENVKSLRKHWQRTKKKDKREKT